MTLEQQIGYTFRNPALLALALTHRSVSSEDSTRANNERLEFLGDAVLQLVVTDYLYSSLPDLAEGKLAKVRAAVVSRPALADVARGMGLGQHVELTPSEERTGGREKDSIIADSMEALIGAVYLDGGLEEASRVVLSLWGDRVDERAKRPGLKDYKTRLQEVLASDGRLPEYLTEGSGPDHERVFIATVSVDGTQLGRGTGRSKKDAEQGAAEQAIDTLSSGSR
ncbi:MAG: ribonuclease III [Actinomycetota bacterium]|nr:ribonuclease III [Actinomycetota bacterium]